MCQRSFWMRVTRDLFCFVTTKRQEASLATGLLQSKRQVDTALVVSGQVESGGCVGPCRALAANDFFCEASGNFFQKRR